MIIKLQESEDVILNACALTMGKDTLPVTTNAWEMEI